MAQTEAHCDSLQAAKHYYNQAEFERALVLLRGCEKSEALEMLALCWFKLDNLRETETTLRKLLTRARNHELQSKNPPTEFVELFVQLKQASSLPPHVAPHLTTTKRSQAPLVQSSLNLLGMLEVNMSWGGYVGGRYTDEARNEKNPMLRQVRIGLEYAELEFGTSPIINDPPSCNGFFAAAAIAVAKRSSHRL